MASSAIVTGFNAVASGLTIAANYVPSKVSGVTNFLAQGLRADVFKTLVIRPLSVAGQTLKYLDRKDRFPVLYKIASDATPMKVMISACEVITKLPKMLQELSKPVGGREFSRGYTSVNDFVQNGVEWTPLEIVSNRVFHVASWAIALGDGLIFAREYFGHLPRKLDKASPWIYTVAGAYMGLQSLITEWHHANGTWRDEACQAVPSEKRFGYLNLVTSAAYLGSSIVGGLGLYYKDKAPTWFKTVQLGASIAITVLPLVQKCARTYMEEAIWARP